MSKKEVVKEQDLQNILDKISDDNKTEGLLLANELSFIIKTLDKLKDMINANGVVEDFKQGKQEFIRESTALKSYNTTMKTYNTTFTNLLKLVDTSDDNKYQTSDISQLFDIFKNEYQNNADYLKEYADKFNKDVNKLKVDDANYLDFVKLKFGKKYDADLIGLEIFDLERYYADDYADYD